MFRVHFRISNFYINSKFWILKYKHLVKKDKDGMFEQLKCSEQVSNPYKKLSELFVGVSQAVV